MVDLSVRPGHGLRAQIDGNFGPGELRQELDQFVYPLGAQPDRQHAVLEHVVVEDVGVGRRDDATDAEIEQCPRRVLAARSTTEVLAGYQNRGFAERSLIQDEVRALLAVLVVASFGEQRLAGPGSLDR